MRRCVDPCLYRQPLAGGMPITLWAQDPPDVARRLLATDGIEYITLVGYRDGIRFSLGYRDHSGGEYADKAVLIELEDVYSAVYGCGGGALWLIIREPRVPDGEVHDHVEITNDMVDGGGERLEIPIDTPRCVRRVFTFEELGISVGNGEDDGAPVLGHRSPAPSFLKDGTTAGEH
jgi:hypothetical protein